MGRLIIKALADLHGYLPPAKVVGRCDVLCICGDICPLDYQHNDTKCVSWFCLDFVPWTKSLDCDKVIFIAEIMISGFIIYIKKRKELHPEY